MVTSRYFLSVSFIPNYFIRCFIFRHLLFIKEQVSIPNVFGVEWHLHYKELKEFPIVKFDPIKIKFIFKVNYISIVFVEDYYYCLLGTKSI